MAIFKPVGMAHPVFNVLKFGFLRDLYLQT